MGLNLSILRRRYGALPLSFKLASWIVIVGLSGIAMATTLASKIVEADLRKEFEASRNEIARQIAANISGAMRFKKADIIESGYKPILDNEKKPIAALVTLSQNGELLTQYAEEGGSTVYLVDLGAAAAAEGQSEAINHVMNDRFISIVPAGDADKGKIYGYLVLDWKTDSISSSLTKLNWTLLISLSLAIFVVVAAIIFLTARLVTTPLGQISARMVSLADSDTNSTVPFKHRSDEIGQIARAVETFREREIDRQQLEASQASVRDLRQARQQKIEDLVNSFRERITSLLRNVTRSLDDMQKTASTLKTNATATNDKAVSVSGISQQASANVQSVASASQQLTAAIREISMNVTRTTSVAAEGDRKAEASAQRVTHLSQAADKIGNVIDLIREIASQTNLLALNATIEAARAGEAGKGFAIVASEVKSLATQTAKATEEIAEQISEIQSSTQETAEAIQGFTKTMSEVSALATTIAAAIEQQSAATAQISDNVGEAAKSTTAVMSNVETVVLAVGDTADVAGNVDGSVGDLRKDARSLGEAIDRFLEDVAAA